jgi:hypothetical protein
MVDSRIAEGIKSVMGELPDELEGKGAFQDPILLPKSDWDLSIGQVGLVGALAMALCRTCVTTAL